VAIKCSVLIPDTHRPYHHRAAYKLMLKIAQRLKPDEVVIMGDYADFYAVQMHGARHPKLLHDLKEEIDDVNKGLDEIDDVFPKARKIYVEGNHETRLERFLVTHALPVYGLYTIKTLLKMDTRKNWQWVSYNSDQRYRIFNSGLYVRHEPFASSPKQSIQRALCSHAYGHVHRIEESNAVSLDQRHLVAFSPGWLGDRRMDVFKYLKSTAQWQLGFAVIYVDDITGTFFHEIIRIREDDEAGTVSAVVDGKVVKL
jgi:hypothetical protein